eukprot:gene35619-43921_t
MSTSSQFPAFYGVYGYLGKSFDSGDPAFNGTINEFRVWSTALSATYVNQNYNTGPNLICFDCPTAAPTMPPTLSPTTAPSTLAEGFLLHRYSFNDGTARDSISGLNATLMQGAYATGGRLVFVPSSGSYVLLPPNVLGSSVDLSIELWLETAPSNQIFTRIFQIGQHLNAPNDNSLILNNNNDGAQGKLEFTKWYGDTMTLTSNVAFNSHSIDMHVVMTFATIDGAMAASMYVNGSLVQSGTSSFSLPPSTAGGYLGKSYYADPPLNGSINEFRVWKTALTSAQ